MKIIIKTFAIVITAITIMLPIHQSYAEDDAIEKAIKARRAGFQLYSFYAGQLFAMAKGEQEYNAELATTMAENLVAVTELRNGSMWLPGSDKDNRPGDTRALSKIWATDSDIGEKAQALKDAALGLSLVAGDGLDSLRSEIGAVGQSCKGCHKSYRAKDF